MCENGVGRDICLQAGKTARIINSAGNIWSFTGLGQKVQMGLVGPRVQINSHGTVSGGVILMSGKKWMGRLGWG